MHKYFHKIILRIADGALYGFIVDAHGDDCSASVYSVIDHHLHLRYKIPIFHSLGVLYTNFTHFLGFKDFEEGKTMALASYGRDTYKGLFEKMIKSLDALFIGNYQVG